ncbi:L-threonylcarbamoyladenylate synthase [Oceanobacillus senegalensis]|uniref:L-threonylcarbamoyladenylate synthase n=1 Tax=Oceanobacillus senegalensis TaxID=1936063 RepID=UPI000A30B8C7|nr:L-threonylcarbamoyladenylate synthase [Oceanobacillus senegalensis]
MIDTKRWNIENREVDNYSQALEEAASLLKGGETVAFPTETVYGLGADATNHQAVTKIFEAKGRPQDNPLIAHVATKEQLRQLVDHIPSYVERLMDVFSPGPITYILESNGTCADNVTAGLSTVGVRIPDHPVARDLLLACDVPVAAPSANLSGKPSPTTANHVWDDLNGKIAGVVDGGATGVGVESTVLDCTQDIPIILRPGGVTKDQLEEYVDTVMVDPALANQHAKPKAPGMKYRHYSPEVPLWLVDGSAETIQTLIDDERKKGNKIGLLASNKWLEHLSADEEISLGDTIYDVATHLYDGLRTFKEGNIDLIICEAFPEDGIGQAVMNRLKKASSDYLKL